MAKAQPAATLVATTAAVDTPAMRKELKKALPMGSSRTASPNASRVGWPGNQTGGSLPSSSERLKAPVMSQKSGSPAKNAAPTTTAATGRRPSAARVERGRDQPVMPCPPYHG